MRVFLLLFLLFLFAQRREELQTLGVSAQLSPFLSEEIREYALTDTNPDTAPILVSPVSYARVTSAVSGAILRLPSNYPELKPFCVFNVAANAVQIRAPTGFLINTALTYSLPSNRFLCLLRLSTIFRYYDYGTADATDATTGNPLTNWLEDSSRNFTQGANAANIAFSVAETGIRFSNVNPFIRVDTSNLLFRTTTTDRWRFTSTGNLESIAGDLVFTGTTHKIRSITDLFIDAQTSIKQQVANSTILDITSSQITANQNISVASGRNITFAADAVIRSGSANTFSLQRGTTSFLSFDGTTITFANPLSISSISSTGDLTLSSGSANSLILRRGVTNQLVLDGTSATFSVEVKANTYTTQSSVADLIINAPSGRIISLRVNNVQAIGISSSGVTFSSPITVSSISSPTATNLILNVPSGQEVQLQTGGITRFALLNDRMRLDVPFVFSFPTTDSDPNFDTLRGGLSLGTLFQRISTSIPMRVGFDDFDAGSTCGDGSSFLAVGQGLAGLIVRGTSSTPSIAVQDAIKNIANHAGYRQSFVNYFLPYGGKVIHGARVSSGFSGNCFHYFATYINVTEWNTGKLFGGWEFEGKYSSATSGSHQRGVIPVFCFRNASGVSIGVTGGRKRVSSQNPNVEWYGAIAEPNQVFCTYGGITAPANETVVNEMRLTLGLHTHHVSDPRFFIAEVASYTKNNNSRTLQSITYFVR